MDSELDLFQRFLFEAPGDEGEAPPDIPAGDTGPPDMPADDGPPEMTFDAGTDPPPGGDGIDDAPPDMGGGDDEFGTDDAGFIDEPQQDDQQQQPPAGLDDKVSAVLNYQLYQRFQTLLTNVVSEISKCKAGSDILYTLSTEAMEIFPRLKRLEENIRLYLDNSFASQNYSANLLFFNKCLNLLKLLNDNFDAEIKKSVKDKG